MKTSESITEINKALVGFHNDIKQPLKDKANPFFKSKYVPLENVAEVIDEVAPKHGLAYLQEAFTTDTGQTGVVTRLVHESGEFYQTEPLVLSADKNNAQGQGSVITYARRYQLASLFGITSDEDDDGNSISGNETKPKSKPKPKVKTVNETQIKSLKRVLLGYAKATGNDDETGVGKLESWALGQLGVENFSDIADKDVKDFVDRITEMTKKKLDESQESLFEGSTTKPKV